MFTTIISYLNAVSALATLIIFFVCIFRLQKIILNSYKYDVRYLLSYDVMKFNSYTEEKLIWQTFKATVLFAYHLGRILAFCPEYPSFILALLITIYQLSALRVAFIYYLMSKK
jgi:hypothetical protein